MDEVRLKMNWWLDCQMNWIVLHCRLLMGHFRRCSGTIEVAKRRNQGLKHQCIMISQNWTFLGEMRFENYSTSTVNQYQRFLTDLLVFVGKPIQEITGEDVVECLNYYEQARQISTSTKDHKRRIASSVFYVLTRTGLHTKESHGHCGSDQICGGDPRSVDTQGNGEDENCLRSQYPR